MNKINVKKWHNYRLCDLFKIKPAKGKNSQQLNDGNDVPYIAASKECNGFNRMVAINGFENWVSEGNCIQLIHIGDAAAGYANYIPDKFIAMSGKSSCAYNKNMSKYSGLFIAAIICKTNKNKYSFKDSWTGDKVKNTIITLPYKTNDEPDWAYMESYMKDIMRESEKKLENLQDVNSNNNKVESAKWKVFIFGKIFQMQKQKEISPVYAYNKNMQQEIKYPFYGQSSENNGIISYISLEDRTLLNNKENNPIIMIHSNNHLSFYVNSPFYLKDGHGATSLFTNKNLNEYNVFFIISVLNKTMADKFDYSLKATKEKLNSLKIKLPVDGEGEPDWEYMENYMKNIMQESEWNIQKLQKLDCCK